MQRMSVIAPELLKMSKAGICVLVVPLMLACTPPISKDDLVDVNYGPEVAVDYEQVIKDYLTTYLKDAESARYRDFSKAEKGIIRRCSPPPYCFDKKVSAGYLVTVNINAKNAYGAYTDFKKYSFIFRDGKVADLTSEP